MTIQEIFDTVAVHLLKQGVRSVDLNNVCLYRGPNGLKCAVGALIPDELYAPEIEGVSVLTTTYDVSNETNPRVALLNQLLKKLGIAPCSDEKRLLIRLQYIHDSISYDPTSWRALLLKVAVKFNLNTHAIDGI